MAKTVSHFINTSVDDCRSSLDHTTADDLPVLREALKYCGDHGHKTRSTHIARRVRKLEKEAAK